MILGWQYSSKLCCWSVLLVFSIQLKRIQGMEIFVSMWAVVFEIVDGIWDYRNPTIVCLGTCSVLSLTEAKERLWCGCGNKIFVIESQTLAIEVWFIFCSFVKRGKSTIFSFKIDKGNIRKSMTKTKPDIVNSNMMKKNFFFFFDLIPVTSYSIN